jgi:transposase
MKPIVDSFPCLPEAILQELPPEVIAYINALHNHIHMLTLRIEYLEKSKQKTSHNSSKPPSSDGTGRQSRTQSLRKRTGRNRGGQKGHPGTTLAFVQAPDETSHHPLDTCPHCQISLSEVEVSAILKRQVVDLLPPSPLHIVEHQAEVKVCPHCLKTYHAPFPQGVNNSVQYGARVNSIVGYLRTHQLLPIFRTKKMMEDLFNLCLSTGTVHSICRAYFKVTQGVDQAIKTAVIDSKVGNFDESGLWVEKKGRWLHVASTPSLTYYAVHNKRGKEAMNDIGILPVFKGTAVHDCLQSYFTYASSHGICNAHILRELKALKDIDTEDWAGKMSDLLLDLHNCVEGYKKQNPAANALPEKELIPFYERYIRILEEGIDFHEGLPPLPQKGRGKAKQRTGSNLIDRLLEHHKAVFLFAIDFSVPFTNNLAERDIRMIKSQQKISGGFQTVKGAQVFCRIKSYLSTAIKNDINPLTALVEAFTGNMSLLKILQPQAP